MPCTGQARREALGTCPPRAPGATHSQGVPQGTRRAWLPRRGWSAAAAAQALPRAWSLTFNVICSASNFGFSSSAMVAALPSVDRGREERGWSTYVAFEGPSGGTFARADMGFGMHDDRDERTYGGRGGGGRGGAPRVNNGTRVFVTNLSYRTSWQDLKDHGRTARGGRGSERACSTAAPVDLGSVLTPLLGRRAPLPPAVAAPGW